MGRFLKWFLSFLIVCEFLPANIEAKAKKARVEVRHTAPKIAIMGRSRCTEQQARSYLLKRNPKVKREFLVVIKYFWEEGRKEGVRGDVAFAKALYETNYFRFGGDVLPRQNNFAGLGATGGRKRGCVFKTPREGIRAQIQHLKAYASTSPLNFPCVDERFSFVKRGSAPYVEDLTGKWAWPGYDSKRFPSLSVAHRARATYGQRIVRILNEMLRQR